MKSNYHRHAGFTLLETILSTIIFVLVIVGSFVLYSYIIRTGVTNKYVSDIKNIEASTVQLLEGMMRVDGWGNFIAKYADTEQHTNSFNTNSFSEPEVWADTSTGSLISPNDNTRYQWKFQINIDPSLGSYIEKVEKKSENPETYEFTFSQNVTIPAGYPLSRLFPCINNPSHSWDYYEITSNIDTPTKTITLKKTVICSEKTDKDACDGQKLCKWDASLIPPSCTEKFFPITSGDILRPSNDIYIGNETDPTSDMTYTKGIELPSLSCKNNPANPEKAGECPVIKDPTECIENQSCEWAIVHGYPHIIKAIINLLLNEAGTIVEYDIIKHLQYME